MSSDDEQRAGELLGIAVGLFRALVAETKGPPEAVSVCFIVAGMIGTSHGKPDGNPIPWEEPDMQRAARSMYNFGAAHMKAALGIAATAGQS